MTITIDNHTATITTTRTLYIEDKGQTQLGSMKTDDGKDARIVVKADYDEDTQTITVHRAAPYSLLGYKELPAYGPLTEKAKQRIATIVSEKLDNGTWDRPFYFWRELLENYQAEVETHINHPDWCDRTQCSVLPTDVEHTSSASTFEWSIADNDSAEIRTRRVLNAEHYKLGQEREAEWIDVRIDGNSMDGFVASPEQLRQIGEYLINEAERLGA